MIEPKNVTVDGMKFQLVPLEALKAIDLDRIIATLLIPIFGGLKELSLDSGIDAETMAKGVSEALKGMSSGDFKNLVIDLTSGVIYLEEGKPPQEVTPGIINSIFRGKIVTLYKLLFEIMKFNKFSPFALLEGGKGILTMFTSHAPGQKQKKSGSKSEKLGGLPGI